MKHKAKPSGSSGGSRLRLTLLLATAAALLLVPAAMASAAVNTYITFEGNGAGTVVGEAAAPGIPKVNCHWNGTAINVGIPEAGKCEVEASSTELGEAVSLKATADTGSKFVKWEITQGNKLVNCGTSKACLVGVSGEGEIEVKAIFEKILDVHVTIDGDGSGTVVGFAPLPGTPEVDCEYTSPGPATGACNVFHSTLTPINGIKVTYETSPGSNFAGWTVEKGGEIEPGESCEPMGETCFLTLEGGEVKLKATFDALPKVKLTVSKTGTGSGEITSSPSGINCGSECSAEYEEGKEVTLTATAAGGSLFTGWSGSGCSGTGTCKVTMSEAKSVSANFALAGPELTVTKEGGSGTVVSNPAGIECGGTCSSTAFAENSKVTLTASPAAGFKFASWKGCEKGGAIGHTCTVTMDKAKTVVAKFGPVQSLTVGKAGSGTGSVKSSPSGISCDLNCSSNVAAFTEGASVVLTATPTKYHTFTGWSGSGCSGTGTCTVTMSAAKSVTAEFAATKFNLTLSKAGGGTGATKSKPASLTCGATCSSVVSSFYAGTEVEVTATPSKGSTLNWSVGSGTCTGSTSPCFVTMSAAKSLTAEFK